MNGLEDDPIVQTLRSRHGNYGLLRFAAGWGVVLAVVLFATGQAVWGAILGVAAICIIIWCNQMRKGLRAALTEYVMFGTAEGQQAIRDEAARRLREGDY